MRHRRLKTLVARLCKLQGQLKQLDNGLTRRAVPEKFAAMSMLNVHLPITDQRGPVVSRYTEPEKDLQHLIMCMTLSART